MSSPPSSCISCQILDDVDGLDDIPDDGFSSCDCLDCREDRELQIEMRAVKQEFEAKKQELKVKMLILKALRAKTHAKMNQNHDLLTCRLPPEVVSAIFTLCVSEDWKSSGHEFASFKIDPVWGLPLAKHEHVKSGPLFLGAICRAWRDIAWATRPLWTTLKISILEISSWNQDRINLMREWLERAGALPLSIHIKYNLRQNERVRWDNMRQHFSEEGGIVASRILSIINERLDQWENLKISGPSGLISQVNVTSLAQGAPNLRALLLRSHDDLFDVAHHNPSHLSLARPSRLLLSRCRISQIHIQWNSLTHILAAGMHLEDCIKILRQAPLLKHYTIYWVFFGQTVDISQFSNNPIVHHALESLEVDYHPDETPIASSEGMAGFFNCVTFPSLTCLKIKGRYSSWAPLAAHIARSSPPLITLWIQDHSRENSIAQPLLSVLRITPLLRDLQVVANGHGREANDFLRLLADTSIPHRAEDVFLPNLRSFEVILMLSRSHLNNSIVNFWTAIPGIFGPISDIHDTRRRPLNALRVTPISYGSGRLDIPNEPSFVSQLYALKREGITLDFGDHFTFPDQSL